jgi:hypothetical protein
VLADRYCFRARRRAGVQGEHNEVRLVRIERAKRNLDFTWSTLARSMNDTSEDSQQVLGLEERSFDAPKFTTPRRTKSPKRSKEEPRT